MLSKTASLSALVLAAGLIVAAPAMAQSAATPGNGMSGMAAQHQQMMSGMMKDMAQQMGAMADQMGHGAMSPDQRKQMGQQMERMSGMMHRMSGMAGHPNMRDPEFQKQMGQMRQQMNGMMRNAPNAPANNAEANPRPSTDDSHGHDHE